MPRIPKTGTPTLTANTADSALKEMATSSKEMATSSDLAQGTSVDANVDAIGTTIDPYQGVDDVSGVVEHGGEWDELAIGDDEEEKHIYRGSAIGNCEAALVAAALQREGADMPESLQPRLDEGTAMEPIILSMHSTEFSYRAATYAELLELKDEGVIAGFNPKLGQLQAILDIGKTARIRTHLDRIATHQRPNKTKTKTLPTFYVVEAKAFGPDYWKKWKKEGIKGFPRYGWQVTGEMASTGLVCIFVVGKKEGQGDDCTISEIDVTVFEEPPFPIAKLKARILKLEVMVKDEDVPPCRDGSWPCAFFKEAFCLGKPKELSEELDDVILGELARRFHTCSMDMADTDEQKQAKKDRDVIKNEIDKYLANSGIERGKKFIVKSEVGESYEFEWISRDVEKSAFTMRFPSIKLLGGVK